MANPGPHGFTEVLYAYTSQTGNNGSAFAGLTGNTLFYNVTGAIAMLVGRFWMIIPAMAIAGSLAAKKTVPASAGTFPTTGGLFVGLVVGVILIVGGLTFFPALALGPIVEHLAMTAGTIVLIELTLEPIPWKPPHFASGCRYRHCSTPRSSCRRSARPSSSSIRARWSRTRSCSCSRSSRS